MKNKVINIILICSILLVIFAGLGRTLLFPKDINYYENRYAEKMMPLTLSSFLDGSFQDGTEKALSDQIHFSQRMKKWYNNVNADYLQSLIKATMSSYLKNHYVRLGDKSIFGEKNIVYNTSVFKNIEKALDERISVYNNMVDKYNDIDFYIYYIEKDTDINFETNEKVGVYEYLREGVKLAPERMACFKVDSFQHYADNFYYTDHHWKASGSYKGYGEVLNLLGVNEERITPVAEAVLPQPFAGSKAQGGKTGNLSEEFLVYRYNFPQMNISINGAAAEDYGEQEAYKTGGTEHSNYGLYYGGDMGEVVFDTGNAEKENLLVIGESFDNAILKLLASHFNQTYSIDLRYYEPYMGKEFHLAEYLSEKDIDRVLLIGNIDYFVSEEFVPED